MSGPRGPQAAPRKADSPSPSQVRPGWLLGALGLLLLAALCCAYLSLCLLFLQGQWQLLYHPGVHMGPSATPASVGLPFSKIRFGANASGVNELTGWWLPAEPAAALARTSIVYLHDGSGSLSDSLPALARIHSLGCQVFAIDYRGYGESTAAQPSEARMIEDARRAITYLDDTRHLSRASLVLWGQGTGATIAAEAAGFFPGVPVILEDVNAPALVIIGKDPRSRLLPVRLLLRDRLDAAPALEQSAAPKLFLEASAASERSDGPASALNGTERLSSLAATPKQLVVSQQDQAVRQFLMSLGSH